ncbi:MAG: hypothetical protein OEY86_07575 [Nitrospira sp.]|nr:hypothetical protein [Nitrospira sp.]
MSDYSASDIERELIKRYPSGEYAYFSQVRNGTGFTKDTRTADAMCLSLWPSRGLELSGFEIKVSRSDWLSELKDPKKADELSQYCDYWYIVAPADIVPISELPATWGLMAWNGKRWKVTHANRRLTPIPLDRSFIASLARNFASGMVPASQITNLASEQAQELARMAGIRQERELKELQDLKNRVVEFEKESGVRIADKWPHAPDVGKAVREVLRGKYAPIPRQEWESLRKHLSYMISTIDQEIGCIQECSEVKV